MISIIDKIAVVQKFISILTWKKIAQLSVCILLIAITWAAYENRQSIYNFISGERVARTPTTLRELSQKTKDDIKIDVHKSELIVAIRVVFVDFQRNTRSSVFVYSDINELDITWKTFQTNSVGELPLFSSDLDSNKAVIDIINGDFICEKYQRDISAKLMPATMKHIDTVCSAGIPPFYGRFMGIVKIYLRRTPTPEEVDQIRALSKNLSTNIYNRDVQ